MTQLAPSTRKGQKSGDSLSQFRAHPLTTLREELDDIVARVFGENPPFLGSLTPPLDVAETDSNIEVKMDLPGIDPEQVDVHVSGNTLNVCGQSQEEREEKGRRFHRVERSRGSFSRTVTLPCPVLDDKVTAKYDAGVLTITLPKCEEARSRKIKVQH